MSPRPPCLKSEKNFWPLWEMCLLWSKGKKKSPQLVVARKICLTHWGSKRTVASEWELSPTLSIVFMCWSQRLDIWCIKLSGINPMLWEEGSSSPVKLRRSMWPDQRTFWKNSRTLRRSTYSGYSQMRRTLFKSKSKQQGWQKAVLVLQMFPPLCMPSSYHLWWSGGGG